TGCQAEPGTAVPDTAVDPGTCDAETGGRQVWVVNSLTFARVDGDISDGFDLDGLSSTTGGPDGCGIGDFTSPTGQTDIDNAFGRLMPALEATEFNAAEPLINSLIQNGELMILAEVAGMDDPVDDECVGLALRKAVGQPLLGTDGEMLWGQTLARDEQFTDVEFEGVSLEAGSVSGSPLTFVLPVQVLDAAIDFPLRDGAFRVDVHADGSISGVVAGGLDVAEMVATAETQNINDELKTVLRTALFAAADLDPDDTGACTAVSLTLAYTGIPIHLFEDAPEGPGR
ncbi:MAG: hypothetical protein VX265_07390, partial [Myxococcota bacterium]|nr:hypothetical protein [Myxococcota bacterium]